MAGEGGGGREEQDELLEAVAAHAVREQTAEYSDDFESDEDGILNGTGEELNESNSGVESTKKSVVESPLSDDDTSQKAPDLENEAADDLTSSILEKKLQQIILLESGIVQDDGKGGEEGLENQNEDDDRKNNEECSPAEKVPCDNTGSDHCSDLPVGKLLEKINQEENRPIPKPRMHKTRNASASDRDQEISTSDLNLEDNTIKSSSVMEKLNETKEEVLQNTTASLSDRSLSSVHIKKKAKPVSSQYLGTLKVLEDKHMRKSSTEFDKADSLRAAVFQNWLEKKRVFLMELKRAEKKKAENLRNDAEKKEAFKRQEAIASFEAWKKKKGRETKTLSEKKKLEELKEKKAAEQNEEKTEAAQKAFEKWKERKVEYLREQSRKEKQSERIRKKKEEELVAEKKRHSMSAVEKWNEEKKEYIKQKKAEKTLERRKQEIKEAEKEEKNKKALEEYEKWLENKERKEQLEKKKKKLQAVHGDEVPFPWSPPGKVTYSMNY
ncbi:microtubule-associated protein 9 [Apus apus]|uniref:microtubule-associated protein 9 n=1 Tax=Apus apus TaxID=8895 RepID=UPI0021F90F9E|nr:microtubule-associated protein 9 [Apus apus]